MTKRRTHPSGEYTAKQITVLEGLAPVRKRPAMYIGSTGPEGLHHLVWEVVDNAIDEAMAGYAKQIVVTLHPNEKIRVEDDGRGIPVDLHKQTKKSALETVLTMLHAGGKFGEGGYKVSGGLHGVGVSVVNALSTWMRAEVKRDGKLWVQEYNRGKPTSKVKTIGKARGTGTTITFQPDPTIFTSTEVTLTTILDHLRQQAYLTRGVTITVKDERAGRKAPSFPYTFHFEGGIASYVRHLNANHEPKHESVFYVVKEVNGVQVEASLQYVEEFKETVFSFANNIFNPEGGTHLVGFRTAITRSLNSYARKQGFLKEKEDNLTGEDIREGLTAVVSVKVKEPQFEGQTKAKLGNPEVRPIVEGVTADAFAAFLEEHPRDAEAIIEKCVLAQQARVAAKAARESVIRKGVLEGLTLPGKLADCSTKDRQSSELFIVEGDSAGGSTKQGRDRNTQAVLPLRGKILNVQRARLDKMLANNELKALIIALGTNIGEQFSLDELRYNRVIIMTDADVDGAHIRTLLLTLFYRYLQEVIRKGHLFIAQPPLYRVQKGSAVRYAYSDVQLEKVSKELAAASGKAGSGSAGKAEGKIKKTAAEKPSWAEVEAPAVDEGSAPSNENAGAGLAIQRYKGLGEMNPTQLWETTMDPARRTLKVVTVEDAERADEIFNTLMGDDVLPRKKFLHTHAKAVKNLDI